MSLRGSETTYEKHDNILISGGKLSRREKVRNRYLFLQLPFYRFLCILNKGGGRNDLQRYSKRKNDKA